MTAGTKPAQGDTPPPTPGNGANERITLVLPTYNRAGALATNLTTMLAMDAVGQIVVVDDGSTDDTEKVCRQVKDDRVEVVRHQRNLGVAAARNSGVHAANGDWVLFGEDDCRFPRDYAAILLAEAHRHGADLVGAPLLYLAADADADVPALAAQVPRKDRPSMEEVALFPTRPIETPFLPARALVNKRVFSQLSFDPGYLVNGYREETDFFVGAARAGFRCLFTNATYCYQLDHWDGGAHQASTLRYEYWAVRNNWRFLRRHGDWMVENRYIRSKALAQAQFAAQRLSGVLTGVVRARIRGSKQRPSGGR
jgi:GT2 family glycosyltransferase